ncbi:MAG: hypothetical protein IIB12_07850 [Chloroflexi bacterium]|nr:hypothetical protein [Chloroflexota bacterium]MCH8283861.1 hypothetical protein [Chloroflexota bacterium]MCI0769865.1 hypothetical protein [Chloroflexota bacterium]
MPRGAFFAFTNCADPKRDEEYNRWYSHTHLADLSGAQGLVSARRFFNVRPGDGPSQYLALYEFESADLQASVDDLSRIAVNTFSQGRHIDCLEVGGLYVFQEVDAARYKPLERLDYPRDLPGA